MITENLHTQMIRNYSLQSEQVNLHVTQTFWRQPVVIIFELEQLILTAGQVYAGDDSVPMSMLFATNIKGYPRVTLLNYSQACAPSFQNLSLVVRNGPSTIATEVY